jgi:hypothetical protein
MRILPLLIIPGLIADLAACAKPDPVASGANEVTSVPAHAIHAMPTPAGGPPSGNTEGASAAPVQKGAGKIPPALQGRWGLTPADCTAPLSDAKGLLIINATELRFYESRGLPVSGIESDRDSIIGTFRLWGEGQTWTKFERLQRNGNKLTRTETNPAASYTYAKC